MDIVLVDIGLPGEVFSVLDYLHELGEYGLIVMTARGHEQDKLQAFNLGADFYLIKPVRFSVLAETIHALGARLMQQHPGSPVAAPVAEKLASSSWVLQPENLVAPSGIAAADPAGASDDGALNAQSRRGLSQGRSARVSFPR